MKKLSKVMVLLLAGSMLLPGIGASAADENKAVETASVQWQKDLDELKQYGIFEGDTNGDFKPQENITRAEMAKAMCKALGLKPDNNSEQKFSDVDMSHWAYGYINTLVSAGIAGGDGGTFLPDGEAVYGDILKMFADAMGYALKAETLGGYPDGYAANAAQLGLTKNIENALDEPCPRYAAFELFSNALDVPFLIQTSFDFSGNTAEYAVADGKDGRNYITFRYKITGIKN